ncbi:NmrA family NAD(P)-binding protein [Nonomuraea jiangxiensis]|uniref:NmrA-like family protein n=1 Tax=Nonomuraea jiangxiensis TaxID=633440 RepID=A0A1G9Q1M9_9ACTN|nr:NmrA family NAD(P)-binding protein [Nonomuraea jiangxiensis]SDM04930.1 NmrA-like family protein [Nonomuraea jiangxiensis]
MSTLQEVFLVGSTGLLGNRLASALLDRGATVRALVRPGAAGEKQRVLDALRAKGVQLVEGDLTDSVDRLAAAVGGASAVVSAVQGGPEVIVEGQANLLRAAERAGAARFVPSDFAIDITRLDDGDNFMIDWRRQAAARFAGSPLGVLSVLNGAFIEVMMGFMGLVDWDNGTFSHWGDLDQPLDVTTVQDTADYTAAAVLDPAWADGGTVRFAGEVLSMRGFHEAVERGSGRRLQLRTLGTADDLRAEIERRAARSQNPFDYVALQYQWCMVTGKAKFDALDNDRYPEVKPTTVEQFVRDVDSAA